MYPETMEHQGRRARNFATMRLLSTPTKKGRAKPMQNSRIALDGIWEFLHVSDDMLKPATIRSITVPGPWQAQFDDLGRRSGTGIYRRVVHIPADFLHERVFLRFGAVFHTAHVWVNGTEVGSHEGGFLPFSCDVTDQVRAGPNEIKVRVESPTDDPSEFPEYPLAEIPFGKQNWYGPLSGIWQSVFLERRVKDHIACLRLHPDRTSGRIDLDIHFARPLEADSEVQFDVFSGRRVVASARAIASRGVTLVRLDATVAGAQSWSPDKPHLYRAAVSTLRDGALIDDAESTFGFRTIEARDGKLFLNGEPFYLRAALDQDYYPDTICTLPSVEFIEDQFRKAKELGLNALRLHIKAPDPRYYDVADRMGMLIWAELPNGGLSTVRSRARKEATLKGIIDRDGNHPSIFCWTIINENWGVDLVNDPDHREWLKRMYAWAKAYDPSRLVVDNSPLSPSFHVETDIADYHFYAAIPDSRAKWDKFVEEMASRPDWLFSPEGDAVIRGDEPLMCSEFGNWGLPHPDKLKDRAGREPWWFETGHDWGEGVMYAHGVEHRFSDWSLDRVFGGFDRFIDAAQWQQFRALKYQIESMRRRPELAGYVITELTDVHWESNGLLDMRRNPRIFHDVFHTINADTVIVPHADRFSYWAGEEARIDLAVANGASRQLDGAHIEIDIDGAIERLAVASISPGAVLQHGPVTLAMPQCAKSMTCPIRFTLRTADGAAAATNVLDVALYPRGRRAADVSVWSPDPDIRKYLDFLGYRIGAGLERADVTVARSYDQLLSGYVRNGGRLLLLPETEGRLDPFFPHWQNVKVLAREGTPWQGDWASSFSWLRRRGAFEGVPGGPMIDLTFDRVIPAHVIANCNLLDFQARVHAGLVVGWIHRPAALAVERGYGKGRLMVSTFRLFRDAPGADPTAVALLDGLLRATTVQISRDEPPANAPGARL